MTTGFHNSASTAHPETQRVKVMSEPMRSWNETRTEYPREKTVAKLFEEVVSAYPDAIAVEFGSKRLTYTQLNSSANKLARLLQQAGVGPEILVGCCIERSLELIVALLAILKAGGAYVPLDPSYPKERFDWLLEDTHTPVMLTQKSLASTAAQGANVRAIFVDGLLTDSDALTADDSNLENRVGPASLAYVMYTSGSTGRPKGVMVENRAIVRLVRNTTFCRMGPNETFLQFAPISFDAATLEIWGPLLNGGRLVVMPPHAASLEDLDRTIRDHGVTTLWLTAGLFNLMVDQRLEGLRPIRQLLAGGDVLSPPHVRKVLENLPNCTLINGYGPTENTTFTCCHSMRPADRINGSIPIGRPISNTQAYILDEQLNPVAPGIVGELYAAGDGVARGYWNDSEATATKFLPNPFVSEPNARMYRTGDLVRWRDDGVIDFLGRSDDQLKILGYRIEPGEIESALQTHKSLKQIYVTSHADELGAKRLVAYYVTVGNANVSALDLKKFLAAKVPQFMIPAAFVQLAAVPLSPNGKVDRKALPAPVISSSTATQTSTELERSISELWQRILRVERIGLDDNFFDLGGDSLLLVAVHSNLQKTLQTEIPVTDLFEFTTIRTLASHLGEKQSTRPSFSEAEHRAQKQREAFERQRELRAGVHREL
jgi:amino acid adenylation domain-containing protein